MTNAYRKDFPLLTAQDIAYLDNAATAQRPQCVLDAVRRFYCEQNANPLRGLYPLSIAATDAYENAREAVRRFLNAKSATEIVFTRNTTEGLNLAAYSYGLSHIKAGDEVVVSILEHHSNLLPWQMVCRQTGAALKFLDCEPDGSLDLNKAEALITDRTKLVAVTHVSNVVGRVNPIRQLADMAHKHGAVMVVDGAQSTPHFAVDVQSLDCDFFAFSGHKIYGPTGVGVLYGKETWLDRLPPYMGGGEMIRHVTFERTTFNGLPFKFEAGTPDYVATTGLARALDYVSALGMDSIYAHEQELARYALERMRRIPGMRILGEAGERDAVISFLVGDIHHLDMGTLLDRLGIAVRTGHHCAEPLMRRLGVEGTVRASFGLYNTLEEVDALAEGIERVAKMF